MGNVQNRQIHRHRRWIPGGGAGGGDGGVPAHGDEVSFWSDGNVLKVFNGEGCKTL